MRTIDELKEVYINTLKDVLDENFDLANTTLQAKMNNQDIDNKFYDICSEKMRKAITAEEYKLLEPHIIELTAEIAKLVLLRMQRDKNI